MQRFNGVFGQSSDYETKTLPKGQRPRGDLGNQCKAKEKEGNC